MFKISLAGVFAALILLAGSSIAQAMLFDFSFSGNGIAASGTLTATLTGTNTYTITGITGSAFGSSIGNGSITGILSPGTIGSNDNMLYYPAWAELSGNGFAFRASNGYEFDISFYNGSQYQAQDSAGDFTTGSFSATAPAPIPGGGLLSFVALGLAALITQHRRLSAPCRRLMVEVLGDDPFRHKRRPRDGSVRTTRSRGPWSRLRAVVFKRV